MITTYQRCYLNEHQQLRPLGNMVTGQRVPASPRAAMLLAAIAEGHAERLAAPGWDGMSTRVRVGTVCGDFPCTYEAIAGDWLVREITDCEACISGHRPQERGTENRWTA